MPFYPICTLLNYWHDIKQINIMPAEIDPLLGKIYTVIIDKLPSYFYKQNDEWLIVGFASYLPQDIQLDIANTIDTLPIK